MAQITVYMNYVIFFQSESDYNSALAIAGSPFIELAPRDAASLFGIPHPYPSGDMDTIEKGIYFIFPFTPGAALNFPNNSGLTVDDTVLSTLVPGQAGNPASIFPAGPDGLHKWSGTIIRSRGAGSSISPPANAISQRRWLHGFEHSADLDGGSSNGVPDFTRDSSRVLEGCGMRAGGPNNRFITQTMVALRPGLTPNTHWDRFYFRARKTPPTSASDIAFWRATCSLGASMGAQMIYQSTGNIKLFNINNAGTYFDKGVVLTPTLNQWYRFDVLTRSGNPGNGIVKVYINGTFALGFDDTTSEGLGTGGNLVSIIFGQQFANTNLGEIDLDDWIGADLPTNVNSATLNFNDANFPIDWLLGSHVRRVNPNSASLTNWTPNSYGILNQDINPSRTGLLTGQQLTSTTSGAQIDGITDAPLQSVQDTIANVLGAAAAVLSLHSSNSGGTDGQLGYRKAGGAVVQALVNQQIGPSPTFFGYLPSGMILPDEISPWHVIHTKSADVNTDNTQCVAASIEYLGVWGPEDDPVIQLPIDRNNKHNAPYPNTQYGFVPSLPAEPVFAVGGTYVGNGTTQDITLPGPAHFIMIRRLASANGSIWFSTSLGPTDTSTNEIWSIMRVFFDPVAGVFKMRVWGNDSKINANAATYQYIAFCDPGGRFMLNGAFCHPFNATTPQANTLAQSGFLADFGFIQDNLIQSGGFTGNGLYFKGPGISANTVIQINAAGNQANGMNFAAGILNTFQALHFMSGNKSNTVYSLWRTADSGSGGCANVMIQATSYVGNGVSPRNISLAPLSGRVPLFVWVQQSGGNGRFRDPSHAGVNSGFTSNFADDGGNGITAVAIDQITVGSSLNSNGVTYTVWAICGATTGMTNGTYYPTYCVPPGGTPPTPPQGDIIVVGNGGIILNGTTPLLMLQDVGGIYTLVPGKLNDTLQDTQTGQPSVNVPILPVAKTGYIGG